jgi:hypothetical protein
VTEPFIHTYQTVLVPDIDKDAKKKMVTQEEGRLKFGNSFGIFGC